MSKFASSLQQVLSRAVGIASLPLNTLEAGLTTLNNKQSAVQGLDTTFLNLQQSISNLQTSVTSSTLNSTVSNGGIVSASLQSGATAGTYSIEVDDLGSYSTALSNAGSTAVTDPSTQGLGTSTSYTLSVGGVNTTITAASSSLRDLSSAINAQGGGQVQATIVNVGSTSSPDYRLSLQATNLGSGAIDLTDSSQTDLIATSTPGSLASYKVDGLSTSITSTTRTVTLAPGLTVNLLGESAGSPTTITVSNNATGISSGFSSFVSAYNAAVDAVAAQHGQSAGALQGDSLLQSLQSALSQLGTYSNGSPATALANYGITVDQTGHLSIDTSTFTTAANANFSGLLSTLGGSTSGGFLQSATNLLNGIEDPTDGLIKSEETDITSQIAAQQTKINDEQATVNQLQTSLTAQISKADSAIAGLESQVSYVTGLFAQYTGASNTQNNGLSTL